MTEITKHIKEDITIESNTNLHSMVSGNISVSQSVEFIVHGTVNGNIVVQNNSLLIIHGTVNGNIINSGLCKIFGMINGKLIDKGGNFEIDPNAMINDN